MLIRRLLVDRLGTAAVLQLAGRHTEGHAPDPPGRLTQRIAARERLRERLGHRVLRDGGVAGERQQRPPDRGPVLPVDGREPRPLAHVGARHIVLGIISAPNL